VSGALFIQHAMRIRHIIICGLTRSTIPFLNYLKKGMIFGGGGELLKKNVFCFSLQLLSETFLILRTIKRDAVINVPRSSRQVPLILVRF